TTRSSTARCSRGVRSRGYDPRRAPRARSPTSRGCCERTSHAMPAERRAQRDRLALRGALLRLVPPLETFAEDVLGLVSRIARVARDPDGGVTLVLVASEGADLARLAEGVAQRVWLEPRLADWNQLAPHLALAPERGVRVLLLALRFDDRTRAA